MTDRDNQPDQSRSDQSQSDQSAVIAFLSDPASHGGEAPRIIKTHAAVLFVAGNDAYKLKRAVRLPYLDFTTRAERERVCRREIELNRRTAPDIYLGSIAVTREASGGLALGGRGEAVDWVVHMRAFDPAATLDHALRHAPLSDDEAETLASEIAAMHEGAAMARVSDGAERIARIARQNIADLREAASIVAASDLDRLDDGVSRMLERVGPLLDLRAREGQVRRCHGDLHLGNVARIGGRPVIFDALEFDEEMATIDVMYDLAFLLMDCWQSGQQDLANALLNRWIALRSEDADLDGLAALPLFLSMRAAVRAKVWAVRAEEAAGQAADEAREQVQAYLDTALNMLAPSPPVLLAVGGFSGSGKSVIARSAAPRIAPPPGAVVLRSDQIRKALAGVGETERMPEASYTRAASDRVYAELRRRAGTILRAGHSVVADAVHGRDEERDAIGATARAAGAAFAGVWITAPPGVLKSRAAARSGDASDATPEIVERQLRTLSEPARWTHIDNSGAVEDAVRGALAVLDAD